MSQEREFRILGSGHNAGLSTETTMMKTFTGTMLGLFAEQGNACFTRFSCYASPLRIRPLVPSDFEAFRAACADEEVAGICALTGRNQKKRNRSFLTVTSGNLLLL